MYEYARIFVYPSYYFHLKPYIYLKQRKLRKSEQQTSVIPNERRDKEEVAWRDRHTQAIISINREAVTSVRRKREKKTTEKKYKGGKRVKTNLEKRREPCHLRVGEKKIKEK